LANNRRLSYCSS